MDENALKEAVREAAREAVHETLKMLGFKVDDPSSMQADLVHLHRWRTTMETVQSQSVMVAVGVFVTGIISAIWLGVQTFFHR